MRPSAEIPEGLEPSRGVCRGAQCLQAKGVAATAGTSGERRGTPTLIARGREQLKRCGAGTALDAATAPAPRASWPVRALGARRKSWIARRVKLYASAGSDEGVPSTHVGSLCRRPCQRVVCCLPGVAAHHCQAICHRCLQHSSTPGAAVDLGTGQAVAGCHRHPRPMGIAVQSHPSCEVQPRWLHKDPHGLESGGRSTGEPCPVPRSYAAQGKGKRCGRHSQRVSL